MRLLLLVTLICLIGGIAGRRKPGRNTDAPATDAPATDAPATDAPADDDNSDSDNSSDSEYAAIVKAAIDSNQCASISSESTCETNAISYYETFEYNGNRVIISSGAPSHAAETELYDPSGRLNPNRRCTRWQYAVVPLNPQKASSYRASGMGSVGWVETGGVVYNHLSSPDGSLAAYYELDSLDVCGGHSDPSSQYHYHLVPYCWQNAADANACQHLGYMLDGYPVYGKCNKNGEELVSCWNQISGTEGSSFSHFEFDSAGYAAGTCHLDEANGYTFPDGSYGYVLTDNMFQTPVGYYGSQTGYQCGFSP